MKQNKSPKPKVIYVTLLSIKKLVDLGYQGIHRIYENVQIPFKKPKNGSLTDE